ncbi:MAG: response regulator, partial [Spirochaetaceae bacterium]
MSASAVRRILLVEDEAIVALDTSRRVTSFGYDVTVARTGEAAIQAVDDAHAKGRPFDLLLMDIDLGAGIDGTET